MKKVGKTKPLILIGGGGHASVLADILLEQGREILAVFSPDKITARPVFEGIPHLTNDEDIDAFRPESVRLVNGVGKLPGSKLRENIREYFRKLGYQFESVVDNSAKVSKYAHLEEGVQVLGSAIVQTGARVGVDSIVNSGAIIEHDCLIGANNHIAPGATLCGQVVTGRDVFIGAAAVVLPGISVQTGSVIGAGSIATLDMRANAILYPPRSTNNSSSEY
ncbi:MAG: acetyltransferase [Neptuniibacter sp.]